VWVARVLIGSCTNVDTEKGDDQEMSVSLKNNEIFIEAGKDGKAPYVLKLVGDNKLEGTIETFERSRVAPSRISFEKVKAGEIK